MTEATPAAAATAQTETAPAAPAGEAGPIDVRNLQTKFNTLLEQRNQFNDAAHAARAERDMLNNQRREKAAGIDEAKAARDAANEEMRKHKEIRNAYQDQAKALIAQKKGKTGAAAIERSLPLMVRKLRNDLQAKIELQQTTQLTIAKERVLVEEISTIWKELKEKESELKKQQLVAVELSGADGDIDALFAQADAEHDLVVQFQKVAQEAHEKFIAAVKEVRVLVQEADAKHHAFIEAKQKADESHHKAMELREKVMQVRDARKAEYDAERREITDHNKVVRRSVNDPNAIERAKESAFEELKKGGKITLGF